MSLPSKLRQRVDRLFEVLELNPWPARSYDLRRLEGVSFDGYRVHIGSFRVVYAVDQENKVVIILKVEKRASAYRDL